MECRTYGVTDVAKLLGISEKTVYAMVERGDIHRLKKVPKIRFSIAEINTLLEIKDEYNPWNFRDLKAENKRLKSENQELKSRIKKVTADLLIFSGEVAL